MRPDLSHIDTMHVKLTELTQVRDDDDYGRTSWYLLYIPRDRDSEKEIIPAEVHDIITFHFHLDLMHQHCTHKYDCCGHAYRSGHTLSKHSRNTWVLSVRYLINI